MYVFMFEHLSPASIGEFKHRITKGRSLGSKQLLIPSDLFSNVSLMELTTLSHPTNLNYRYITKRDEEDCIYEILIPERDSLYRTLIPE